ncbi:MAG: hypothetical protein A2Z57_04765 [Planctomycetes bacterium RIFCSPHIGHO2_12_39_6]|nr:MAG: hypothetical protein A2Z57_04765 [Planctomycetes bacterium RIFCSPHIGHO2_12_39_6]
MLNIHPTINKTIEVIRKRLLERFSDNLKCLILYGSWAKGTAHEDSDIDLLVILNNADDKTRKLLYEIERDATEDKSITLLSSSVEEFQRERIPLYTAIKKEGNIIMGEIDIVINPEPPHIKYADYFEKSKEFETKKVKMAENIIKEYPSYGSADLCFVASKHAIQMALAIRGIGYSSKVVVLLPLAKENLGEDITDKFKRLFELYIKSEYGIEFLSQEEARLAIEYAKEILTVCYKQM